MHNYHILRKTCLLAVLALSTMLGASADTVRPGVHEFEESKAVSDEKAHEFLAMFGWKATTTDGKDYEHIAANSITPVGVDVNEMLLVEVNPHWRGVLKHPTADQKKIYYDIDAEGNKYGANLWQYAKYGIKAIQRIGAPNKAANGKLYSYSGKLGRFFFAKRRSKRYGSNGDITERYAQLGRWYDEWSLLPPDKDPTSIGWADFASMDHYNDFLQGAVWSAPHNCANSLDMNHFVSFIKEGTEDSFDGYNTTVLFYVSDYWDSNDKKGSGTVSTSRPFVLMLRAVQDPTSVAMSAVEGKYDITLTFSSTFTQAENTIRAYTTPETMWKSGSKGVREYFDIYRTDKDGNRTPVATNILADQLVKNTVTGKFTYIDTNGGNHFYSSEVLGTDYVYDVTSKLYNVDENGDIIGGDTAEPFTFAKTENRPAHIPGQEAFSLTINGETTCHYTPSTTFGEGFNTFSHIIDAEVVKSFIYSDGDILELRQYLGSSTEYTVLAGYTETLAGSDNIKTIIERAPTEGKPNWQKMTYSFTMPGGETQDATYQLVLKEGDKEIVSNKVHLSSYSANISAGTFNHRSGHPSENGFCPNDETYHSEITFTPTTDAKITTYAIICNGHYMPRVALTPEDYGHLGEPYTYADLYNSSAVNSGEAIGTISQKDIFYTVVAIDINGNTYGSADVEFTFEGTPQELVYYGGETKTEVSHNDWGWGGKFDVNLLAGSNTASDVKPELILGVKIYGKFYEKDGNEEVFVEERELCSFIGWNEDLKYSYDKDINLYYDPDFKTEKAALLEVYNNYGTESEQAKAAWEALCEDFWYRFIPRHIYAEITFLNPDINLIIKGAPVARAALSNSTYTKYTNWAELSVPDFKNPIITAIDNIGVDDPAAPAEYYDMHGRRVPGPTPGQLLIRRQGTTVTKVF